MIKIDNFEKIKPFINFGKEDDEFFFVQIIIRKKDHKDEDVHDTIIQEHFIKSVDDLDKFHDGIVNCCENYHARAYINLSPKRFSDMRNKLMLKLAIGLDTRQPFKPMKDLTSAAMSVKSEESRWVVDIDDVSQEQQALELIEKLHKDIDKPHSVSILPSPHGEHIITSPFNSKIFTETFPGIDIQKNARGTILYASL